MSNSRRTRDERLSLTGWAPIQERLTPGAVQELIERAWAIHTEEVPLFVAELQKSTGLISAQEIIDVFERTAALRTQRVVAKVFESQPRRRKQKR